MHCLAQCDRNPTLPSAGGLILGWIMERSFYLSPRVALCYPTFCDAKEWILQTTLIRVKPD
jgi:hypothetical protein